MVKINELCPSLINMAVPACVDFGIVKESTERLSQIYIAGTLLYFIENGSINKKKIENIADLCYVNEE